MNPTPEELEQAKQEGWIARTSGFSTIECPYKTVNDSSSRTRRIRRAWYSGYYDASHFLEQD